MAEPKERQKSSLENYADRRRKEIEKEKALPLIAERWYVVEKWPDWKTTNEYDYGYDHHTGKRETYGYYKTELDAQTFIDKHNPTDPKGTFTIHHEFLRTHTKVWNEWGMY